MTVPVTSPNKAPAASVSTKAPGRDKAVAATYTAKKARPTVRGDADRWASNCPSPAFMPSNVRYCCKPSVKKPQAKAAAVTRISIFFMVYPNAVNACRPVILTAFGRRWRDAAQGVLSAVWPAKQTRATKQCARQCRQKRDIAFFCTSKACVFEKYLPLLSVG